MRPDRPLVAVAAYHLADDRVSRWPRGGYGVPAPYVERARAAGARTAILAPGESGKPGRDPRTVRRAAPRRRRRRGPGALRGRGRRHRLRRRVRPRHVRDRPPARGRSRRPADAVHLSRHAGPQRGVRRHAAPAPAGHAGAAPARCAGRRYGVAARRRGRGRHAAALRRPAPARWRAPRTTIRASTGSGTACGPRGGAPTASSRPSSRPTAVPGGRLPCSGTRRTRPRSIRPSRACSTSSSAGPRPRADRADRSSRMRARNLVPS